MSSNPRPWKTWDRPDQIDQLELLNKSDLDLLLQLAKVSVEHGRKSGGYVVGGELFKFSSQRELEDLIDDALAVRTRRNRKATAA